MYVINNVRSSGTVAKLTKQNLFEVQKAQFVTATSGYLVSSPLVFFVSLMSLGDVRSRPTLRLRLPRIRLNRYTNLTVGACPNELLRQHNCVTIFMCVMNRHKAIFMFKV